MEKLPREAIEFFNLERVISIIHSPPRSIVRRDRNVARESNTCTSMCFAEIARTSDVEASYVKRT